MQCNGRIRFKRQEDPEKNLCNCVSEMMLRRNNMKENIEGRSLQIIQGPPENIKPWNARSILREGGRTYLWLYCNQAFGPLHLRPIEWPPLSRPFGCSVDPQEGCFLLQRVPLSEVFSQPDLTIPSPVSQFMSVTCLNITPHLSLNFLEKGFSVRGLIRR